MSDFGILFFDLFDLMGDRQGPVMELNLEIYITSIYQTAVENGKKLPYCVLSANKDPLMDSLRITRQSITKLRLK
jgi:hypothetical protein